MNQISTMLWRTVDNITYNWNSNRRKFYLKMIRVFGVLTAGLLLTFGDPFGAPDNPALEGELGWVQLAWLVISIGLSLLASELLAEDIESPIQSDKPTTLTTRGSYTTWIMGKRRVGPVFAWAGEREIRKESAGGGKGGPDIPDTEINYESGWHILGVGPIFALHEIIQSGKTIFTGPISADSHPSGTTVDLGKEGSFTIYWGESDQPVNAFLGNINRVTISSRWPHTCYVVWNKKRMTGSAWPVLDYVLERRPSANFLSQSQGWYEPNRTLTGESFVIQGHFDSPDQDLGYFDVNGNETSKFKPLSEVELTGTGMPNGAYEILRSEVTLASSGVFPNESFAPVTRVFLQGATVGILTQGSVQLYVEDDTDGANIAHIVTELLFAPFPQGLELDPNHLVEKWDMDSLEDLGVEAQDNLWRSAILGTRGETAEAILGAILQDHGTMIPIDTSTGAMLFQRVRFPSGVLKNISADIYADSLPEVETIHGEQPVDRLIFTFSDRTRGYGDMTIAIDEDGQAAFAHHQRARKIPIVSTTLFATAAAISELRSPEELSPGAQFRLNASREARDVIPGEAITTSAFDEVLRVFAVEVDPLSERVSLTVVPDFYGVPLSSFVTGDGGALQPPLEPESDEAFTWAELPEQLLSEGFGSTTTIMVPRIRNHDQVTFSSIYLSADNVTYTLKAADTNVQTGGITTEALSADGPTFVAQSVEFTELGPDNAAVSDFSSDLTSWGLGKQLVLIDSSAGYEICFVQKTTIVSGTERRLDGLMRARYDTRKLSHPVGATIYIINSSNVTEIQDGLLEPTTNLWVKSQPGSGLGQVNLSAIGPVGDIVEGKGVVPIAPEYVHVRAPFKNVPAFQTGDNITVSWALSTGTRGTACGFQSAGLATGNPVIPGTLNLELLTTGDVVKSTISIAPTVETEYEITNVDLVAAFGSEPSAFKVRVTHIANGYTSQASPSLTINRV